MSEPLDTRMKTEIIDREWSGPWRKIALGWANEVTALIIERDALQKQVKELLPLTQIEPSIGKTYGEYKFPF